MSVSVTVRLTNMQMSHTRLCIILKKVRCFSRMYEQLSLPICLSASATVSDFHVKLFRLLDRETDSEIHAGLSSLKSCDWLKNDTLKYYSEKMFQACSITRGGWTFKTIISAMGELGYFVEWQVLNSSDFGIPQNRERVFIIGHYGGEPRRKVFPIGSDSQQVVELQGHNSFISNTLKVGGNETVGTYPVDFEGGCRTILKVNGFHKK